MSGTLDEGLDSSIEQVELASNDVSISSDEGSGETSLVQILPNEVLLHIFSFLTVSEVKKSVALTCKRWWAISKSPSLLVDLRFGPFPPTEVILRVLQGAPVLKRLAVYARNDVNDLVREVTASNLKIARLKVCSSKEGRHTDLEAEVVMDFLRACKNLRSLVLKRVAFDNPEMVYQELGYLAPQLLELNVNHSVQLDTALLHKLILSLPKMRDLRLYCLSYNRIGSVTPYADSPIVEALMKMGETLKVLKLNMLGLTDSIMPLLAALPNLRVLHLYRLVNSQDEHLLNLSRLEGLKTLVVTVPRTISAGCWAQLFGTPGLSSLGCITVSNSYSLDDSALRVIGGNCHALEELSVPGCRRITDAGLTHVVTNCQRLLRLNLFSTKSVVSQAFVLLPRYLPGLQLLIYKPVDTNIYSLPPELEEMPHLKVSYVYRYL